MKPPVKNFNFLKYPYGDCTQWFAENPELYQKYANLAGHNGIDIVRPYGEHIYAVEGGIVADTKEDVGGYGKHIRILTTPNSYSEMRDYAYGHLSYIHVRPGQTVVEGQFIGKMGNTGFVVSNATGNGFWSANPYAGTHLHLGVRTVAHDGNGWKYPGYGRGLRTIDYGNGYKGRYDPLPLLTTPKALQWARIADKRNDALLWQLANILRAIKI